MVLFLPDSWSNWNLEMLLFEGRETPPGVALRAKERNQPQTLPTYAVDGRIGTQASLVGGKYRSTEPSLALQIGHYR